MSSWSLRNIRAVSVSVGRVDRFQHDSSIGCPLACALTPPKTGLWAGFFRVYPTDVEPQAHEALSPSLRDVQIAGDG